MKKERIDTTGNKLTVNQFEELKEMITHFDAHPKMALFDVIDWLDKEEIELNQEIEKLKEKVEKVKIMKKRIRSIGSGGQWELKEEE